MKNTLITLVVLAILGFIGWPYAAVFQLDSALRSADKAALDSAIDLDAIRMQRSLELRKDTDRLIGSGNDDVTAFFREGAKALTDRAMNAIIDADWVRTRLRRDGKPANANPYPPLIPQVSYAFFESYDRFLVRLGALGDNPVHVTLQLKDWSWVVVAIHD